jgi:hypothetical protein
MGFISAKQLLETTQALTSRRTNPDYTASLPPFNDGEVAFDISSGENPAYSRNSSLRVLNTDVGAR